jgi:exopolysaccharide biosynthesis polyprenyl glycosylphosphotransferase
MATSEYIPEKGARSEHVAPVSPVRLGKSGNQFSASVLAPLPMVFNDVIAILLAFGAALVLRAIFLDKVMRFSGVRHSLGGPPLGLLYLAWFVLVYVVVARRYGLYGPILKSAGGAHEIRMTAQACLNAGMLLCGAVYMTHNLAISRALVVLLTLSAMVSLCARRAVWRLRRYRQYERGLSTRHVVILGTNHLSYALGRQIKNESRLGYTLRGHILAPGCTPPAESLGFHVLGGLDELRKIARKYFIDEVIITDSCPMDKVIRLLKEARELGIDVRSISGYYNDLAMNAGIEYMGAFPLVSLHRNAARTISMALKRAGDFVLSLLALIAASPVMLAIAIAIRLESPGPVFYISERIGKRGRVFSCFKFRTMVANADELKKNLDSLNERDGVLFKLKNDPRVTRLGRFLRKYSLDELPQFFNVIRGEMSLVGPRPPIASEVEKYKLEHLRRLEVLPGLTGLWQIEARQDASFEKYIALDTAYVENWSFWLDMKILFRTAEVVVRGTGT